MIGTWVNIKEKLAAEARISFYITNGYKQIIMRFKKNLIPTFTAGNFVGIGYDLDAYKVLISPDYKLFERKKLMHDYSNRVIVISSFKELPSIFQKLPRGTHSVPCQVTQEGIVLDVSAFR